MRDGRENNVKFPNARWINLFHFLSTKTKKSYISRSVLMNGPKILTTAGPGTT